MYVPQHPEQYLEMIFSNLKHNITSIFLHKYDLGGITTPKTSLLIGLY